MYFQLSLPINSARPMVLVNTWLMAKESHAMKYVNFYAERGLDVLKVRTSPFDLLHPTKGSQVSRLLLYEFFLIDPL